MKEELNKNRRKERRLKRVRSKLLAKKGAPRLTVFRSNKHVYAQIIDDVKGVTLIFSSEKDISDGKLNKTQKAEQVGKIIAQRAKAKKIKNVVFDKGEYKYHGRIKALAEGARAEGLVF